MDSARQFMLLAGFWRWEAQIADKKHRIYRKLFTKILNCDLHRSHPLFFASFHHPASFA